MDSEFCSIRSTKIDFRSFSINCENNAALYSERLARELEEDVERDLAPALGLTSTGPRYRGSGIAAGAATFPSS